MNNLLLTTSINIKASAEDVWHALTDKEMVKKYFFGTDLETTWEIGKPITFSGEWEGKVYKDKGTIHEIVKDKFLKYTYWSSMSGTEDKPENYANVTYSLSENGDETLFTLTQDGIKSEEQLKHSEENWQHVFKAMKELIEK